MTTRDTGTEDLLADLDAGVLTLTLNRPLGAQRHERGDERRAGRTAGRGRNSSPR